MNNNYCTANFVDVIIDFDKLTAQNNIGYDDNAILTDSNSITFVEQIKKFAPTVLKGIWDGIKISEKDIKNNREDLLNKLEEKW